MSKTTDVLETIKNARENGDFDLVKRLSKRALENPQSDIDRGSQEGRPRNLIEGIRRNVHIRHWAI